MDTLIYTHLGNDGLLFHDSQFGIGIVLALDPSHFEPFAVVVVVVVVVVVATLTRGIFLQTDRHPNTVFRLEITVSVPLLLWL